MILALFSVLLEIGPSFSRQSVRAYCLEQVRFPDMSAPAGVKKSLPSSSHENPHFPLACFAHIPSHSFPWPSQKPCNAGVYPYPLVAGSARPNPKMAPQTQKTLYFLGFSVLRGGPRSWSETMVSEWGQTMGWGSIRRLWKPTGSGPIPKNQIYHPFQNHYTHQIIIFKLFIRTVWIRAGPI